MDLSLLKTLSEAPGVPGREEKVRDIVARQCAGIFDETRVDAMGNLIAIKHAPSPSAKRVLLACHLDEIGFYVRHIDDRGFLRLQNAGWFDTRNLLARRVRVQSSAGQELLGLLNPGGRPIHIAREEDRKKIPEISDFFVDLCLPPEQVKKMVRIGDPVTLVQEFAEIGNCISGKSLDNRIAPFVTIEAMRKAKNPRYEIAMAATVQEEVGSRGAGPAAFAFQPDIAISVDVTLAVDTPGTPEEERITKQGDGVALTVFDSGTISDRSLIDEFHAVATAHDIPCQLSILPLGGTDTATMQRSRIGCRAMMFSVPTRYIHTITESIHQRDLQSAIDLLAAWLDTEAK